MKNLFQFLIIPILFLALNACSKNNMLIKNGFSEYSIYISENAIPAEKYAARELQKTLKEMSGCELPIIHSNQASHKTIFIGFEDIPKSVLSDLETSEFGNEEFIIRTVGENLFIAGGKPRGTLYGVIAYLNNLGCRWYTREVTKIPKMNSIPLPDKELREKPAFEYRETWYKEAYDSKWAMHNRLNPLTLPLPHGKQKSRFSPIPDSLGGSYIKYPFAHTFYQLVPPEKYFKEYPEYFSLIDGERRAEPFATQLCLTNPSVVKIATETVFRWIKENPKTNVFTVDQMDGYGYCECDNCKKLDDAEGSHAGTLLHFVNQIADTVAKVYPKIQLQTLAYTYTEVPPKTIKPADNVTIRLCHYEYCSAHSMLECDSHKPFIETLQAWKKIAKRITIWDYYSDYHRYLLPWPNFESVVNNVRYYADNGCVGFFAQGSYVPDNGGGEFTELRAWVFAQLMWNPWQDGWKLIEEFVDNVYGPSAPYITEYIKMLHEKVKPDDVYFSIYAKPSDGGYLTLGTLQEAEELFIKAEEAATGDIELLKRVELAHLPILFSRLAFYSIGGRANLNKEKMPAVLEKFERIIKEHKITKMAETPQYADISAFVERVKSANEFITDWQIIGTFENTDGNGLQTVYPPEKEIILDKTYGGLNGSKIKWQSYANPLSGYINFTKLFNLNEEGVVYTYRVFKMDKNEKLKIGVGSNDGVRMWLNGKLVLDHATMRRAEPNQEILNLDFNKGDNTVLIKIDQFGGGWGLYFSVL